jgi:hypothetical protein
MNYEYKYMDTCTKCGWFSDHWAACAEPCQKCGGRVGVSNGTYRRSITIVPVKRLFGLIVYNRKELGPWEYVGPT